VAGEVTHALQVGAHPHRGDDGAQVGGDGLLAGQQVEGQLVQVALDAVDLLVGGDDALGDGEVGVEQGRGGPGHAGAGQPGHLHQLVGEAVEVVVERAAHDRSVPAGGERSLLGR